MTLVDVIAALCSAVVLLGLLEMLTGPVPPDALQARQKRRRA